MGGNPPLIFTHSITRRAQKEIMVKLDELERKFTAHDSDIRRLFATVRQLMVPPEPKKRKIGFLVEEKAAVYRRR